MHGHGSTRYVRSRPPSLCWPRRSIRLCSSQYLALLADRQLQINYRRRGEGASVEYRVHPLALIQRGSLVYLYVRIFDYEDTRMLVLHRIVSAQMLDEATLYPAGFDIDAEIAKGRFGFGDGTMILLKARFKAECGEHLYETPLSKDQKIEELPDGDLIVTATVADTSQLGWWLLALGDGVEVLEPAELRTEIAGMIQNMGNIYLAKN